MAEDIVLTARLDNRKVLDALKGIGEEAEKMAERGDGATRDLANVIQGLEPALKAAAGRAASGANVFVKGFTEGKQSAEEFNASILKLLGDMKKISAESVDTTPVDTGPGTSGARNVAIDEAAVNRAEERYRSLRQVIDSIFDKGGESARAYGRLLQGLGESWADNIEKDAEEANQEIGKLITQAKELERALEFNDVDVAEDLKLSNVNNEIDSLKQTSDKLLDGLSKDAQEFGQKMVDSITHAEERFGKTGNVQQFKKEIQAITTETNKFQKNLQRTEIDLAKQLNTEQARNQLSQLNQTSKTLLESSSKRARNLGTIYRKMGVEAFQAFRRGEISAEDLNKELKKIEGNAKADARSFGLLATEGNRASASMFKLGLTFDRLGARGPATVLRLSDALKGIHPAAIAATLGVVALTAVVVKLGQAFVNLAKDATKAFIDITKNAVKTSGEFETLERQLTNIFKGKADLARATLDEILNISAEFGFDLTEGLAQVFLPLIDSFEQLEQLGQIASTLGIAYGQTQDSVTRALTQAQAEQFITLKKTFKLNQTDIDRIVAAQKELGNTAGLIRGLQEFMEATGREWDTYEDTLQRVIATFEILKKQFLLAFGEPIKNEVIAALIEIGDWVQENKDEIQQFLNSIGQIIGRVVERVGAFLSDAIQAFDEEDLDRIVTSFSELGLQIESLVDDLNEITGDEFDPLVDAATTLSGLLEDIVKDIRILTQLLGFSERIQNEYGGAGEGVASNFLAGLATGFQKSLGFFLPRGGPFGFLAGPLRDLLTDEGEPPPLSPLTKGEKPGPDDFEGPDDETTEDLEEYEKALKKVREAQAEFIKQQERTFEDLFGQVIARDLDERIETVEKRITAAQTRLEALEAVKVELAEIDFADLQNELLVAEGEIETFQSQIEGVLTELTSGERLSQAQRRALDIQLETYRKLEQAALKHYQKLEDLQTKREQQERDQGVKHGDKLDDIATKFKDKLLDIEIERAKKIEEIETKHRDRLLEIRKRFDFDAQEAARRNDAVALLRIRRRMELELELAEERADNQKRDVGKDADDRAAAAKRALDREVRDQEEANRRKLRDIAQSFEDQIDAIQTAYERQINEINEQEAQKRQDLLVWLNEQLADFKKNNQDKLEDLQDRYKDEIAIINRFEREKLAVIQRWQVQQARAQTGTNIGVLPGTGSRFGGGTPGSRFDADSPTNLAGIGTSGTGGESPQMASWRTEAIKLANQLGQLNLLPRIRETSNSFELRSLMNFLRAQTGLPPRLHGGRVSAGMSVLTGERGPEPFTPIQSGIIAPNSPLSMPTMLGQIPGGSVDNSRSVTANMSMLDPSTMSPVQITLIRNIVTEEILKAETI
jgi:hypothetical protein